MAKTEEIKKDIKEAVAFLDKHFKIKEVILFGSQVSGKADKWSDIDLAVISSDFKGKTYEEIIQVFSELAIRGQKRVELHPYTPAERKSARPTNFLGYIVKNGRVVFQDGKYLV